MPKECDASKVTRYVGPSRNTLWSLIVICFFLPSVRGCHNEISYPYQDFLKDPKAESVLLYIYVYPILLTIGSWIIAKITKRHLKFGFVWACTYVLGLCFIAAIYLLFSEGFPNVTMDFDQFGYYAVIVLLWGVVYLGLARIRTVESLI